MPPATPNDLGASAAPRPKRHGCRYRPWAKLLKRSFGVDVLECPKCKGRMRLLAVVPEPKSARYRARRELRVDLDLGHVVPLDRSVIDEVDEES